MIIEEILSKVSMKAPTLLLAFGLFILFWVGGRICKAVVQRRMNEKSLHVNISRVLAGIIKNIMLILGLITALGTMGVNISAIVAGLGLTGFAFGFAFKDMMSNFISGVLILSMNPLSSATPWK